MVFPLMSSLEASPAKTSRLPENLQALRASEAGYGLKSADWLASLDLNTSSWKTSQTCLLESGELGLAEFCETWPRSGMMHSGIAYQLPPLAPLTDEIESGSYPTARKQMSRRPNWTRVSSGEHRSNIEDFVAILEGANKDAGRQSLSPEWCEWLMGYPAQWTVASNASEILSSRKSPKSSVGRS